MEIIGVWFDGVSGQVRKGPLAAAISQKPAVPGLVFDQLVYDPSVNTCFLVSAGKQRTLSQEEKDLCAAFVEQFMAQAEYPVFAWDDLGVYMGQVMRTEAESRGWGYTVTDAPDHPASKRAGGAWQRIRAAITENGALRLDPDGVCGACLIVMSASEWEAFPQPDTTKPWLVWDFALEAWTDKRDLSAERYTLRLDVINGFEHIKIVRFGRSVTEDERRAWDALHSGGLETSGLVDMEQWKKKALEEKARYEKLAVSLLLQREQWLFCVGAVTDLTGLDLVRADFETWLQAENSLDKAA